MTEGEIIKSLERAYAGVKPFPRALDREDRLIEDLGLDSLDIVEMLAQIEDEFGVDLTDNDEALAVRTVGSLVDLLARLGAAAT